MSRILPWNEYEDVCEGVGTTTIAFSLSGSLSGIHGRFTGKSTFARVKGGVSNDRTLWSKEYGFQRFWLCWMGIGNVG